MIFTAIIAKKYYEFQRYIFVTMIAFGVGLFIYKEGVMTSNEMLLGYTLIFISLLLEGFLAGAQSKMRIQSKPSSINYMFYVNTWCAVLIIPLILINFEFLHFMNFCMKHIEVGLLVLLTAITGSIGHYYYYIGYYLEFRTTTFIIDHNNQEIFYSFLVISYFWKYS